MHENKINKFKITIISEWSDGSKTISEIETVKLKTAITALELFFVAESLKMCKSFIKAADFIGICRNTFSHKMRQFKIRKNNASVSSQNM